MFFLTQIILYLYEKFVDLQRDLETRMLNLKGKRLRVYTLPFIVKVLTFAP